MTPTPQIIIIAGPNGAGKSTSATLLVPEGFEFVNADEIAKTLPDILPEQRDIHAGRLMLKTLDDLEARRQSFAVETTLANRSLIARIERLRGVGYNAFLFFLWVSSVDVSIARVAERVRRGGHNIPEETIRRRFRAGLDNFFRLYIQAVDGWRFYDNSALGDPRLVASGGQSTETEIIDASVWHNVGREI